MNHDSASSFPSHAPEGESRTGSVALATRLRNLILSGAFPPGSTVSQGELAAKLQAGRTPLREAIRLLQQEGLLQAELNQRVRIPDFDPQVVDALYATCIVQEALGVQLTVPRLTAHTLTIGEVILQEMETAVRNDDQVAWQDAHRRFHRLLVSHAGEYLERMIVNYADRCEYYWQMYYRDNRETASPIASWEVIQYEHRSLLEAYQQRDVPLAVRRLAQHLSRIGFAVLTHAAPTYDPVAIDAALRLVASP